MYGTNYTYMNDHTDWPDAPTYMSFTINNISSITHDKTLTGKQGCNGSAIFIEALPVAPYTVYGFDYWGTPGCGQVMSVDGNGVLNEVIQDYEYWPQSGVHGSAFNKAGTILYAADTLGNAIWTQPIDTDTGILGDPIDIVMGPNDHAEPRHVTLHTSGKALYAVMEGSNEMGWYSIDCHGKPKFEETFTLLPEGTGDDNHWANEVVVSPSGKYVWSTTRGRGDGGYTGYISVFEVEPDSGKILDQNFLLPTSTSGGVANVVVPSLFDDRYVALTDNSEGFVEIWKLQDDAKSAKVVSKINLGDKGNDRYTSGCCSGAIWLD